jgi:hypothetical protein
MPIVRLHYGSNDPDRFVHFSDEELVELKDIETRVKGYLCDEQEGRDFVERIYDNPDVKAYDYMAYVYA